MNADKLKINFENDFKLQLIWKLILDKVRIQED